jgi:hypothetical protein
MSATTAGALKAYIETLGLGVTVFRDRAPKDAPLPLVIIQEGISMVPDRDGDFGDPAAVHGVAEQAQVSLFQAWRKPDGTAGETYTLPGDLVASLQGAQLPTAPTRVYGVRVIGKVRIPGIDAPGGGAVADNADGGNVIHDAITVELRRNL